MIPQRHTRRGFIFRLCFLRLVKQFSDLQNVNMELVISQPSHRHNTQQLCELNFLNIVMAICSFRTKRHDSVTIDVNQSIIVVCFSSSAPILIWL